MKGFTLIELMVVIGISLLMVGLVLVNYNAYSDSQRLKQAALTLKNNLRFAHSQAFSGKKPTSGCTELVGYTVTFTSVSYSVQAECTEGPAGDATTATLATGLTFSPVPSSLTFGVLTSGIVGSAGATITLTGSSKTYAVQVSANGEVNDLGFQ